MSNFLPKPVRDLIELRRDIGAYERFGFRAQPLVDEGVVQARQLLAGIYLKNGSISPDQLAENGTLNDASDPYWRDRSEYFGVCDEGDQDELSRLYTAARFIKCAPGEGVDSLQIHVDELSPEWQEYLRSLRPDSIREVASLIKEPEASSAVVLALIREMLHYSLEHDIDYWVWGLHPKIAPKFKFQFGQAMTPMGDSVHLGSLKPDYVPFLLDIKKTWELVNHPTWRDRLMGRAAIYHFFTVAPGHSEDYALAHD